MKKEEIYVVIDSEEKRLRAIQILTDAGEKIWKDSCIFEIYSKPFILANDNTEWLVMIKIDNEKEITLDQLEQLLNPKQEIKMKLDALKLIAESYGFELVEKKREIKVGDFGKFWDNDNHHSYYSYLERINESNMYQPKGFSVGWKNFAHLTDEEKKAIQQNW
jgi:hypothetical protein